MKHGSSFLFRRKEAKENQIGGCAILTLPRGRGCIMEHGPSSLLRRTRGRLRGEAQRRERANAGESCVVIGRNAAARYAFIRSQSPSPHSVFCFFSSRKENGPLLFRRTRGRLRGEAQRRERANAGESCVVIGRNAAARYAFIRSQSPSPRSVFCFFSSRKENVPPSL